MEIEKLEQLIGKYIEGKASVEEARCLDEWYASFDSQGDLHKPYSLQERDLVGEKFSELMAKFEFVDRS